MRRILPWLSIALLAACAETSAPAGDDAAGAMIIDSEAAAFAEGEGSVTSTATAAPPRPTGATAGDTDRPEQNAVATGKSESAASLPLQRGFYVTEGTACGQASNATLMLVRKRGINTSRVPCDFKKIEKTGPNSYRVTESCSEGGAAWGTEEQISTSVSTYEILNDTGFTVKSDGGWESSARYCPQPSLPEPWRNNDITDLIND